MHRLSVCAALEAACAGQPAESCPQLGCAAAAAPGNANFSDYFTEVEAAVAASTVVSFDYGAGAAPMCEETTDSSLARPQPDVPVCPYCNVDVPPDDDSAEITMSIASDYIGSILSLSMIAYDSARSPTTFEFDAEVVDSLNDDTVGVTQVNITISDLQSATLLFEIQDASGGSSTQSNPLVVNR